MSKHTPDLPWCGPLHADKSPQVGYNLHDAHSNPGKIRVYDDRIEVAELVASSINHHAALVEALRAMVRIVDHPYVEGPPKDLLPAYYTVSDSARVLLAEIDRGGS